MSTPRTLPQSATVSNEAHWDASPVLRLIRQVLGKSDLIMQHRTLVRAFSGDRLTAALFEALAYYDGKGSDPEWVYKTVREWREELLCGRYQFDQSVKKLEAMGLVERKRRLCPKGTTVYHYRLRMEAATDWLLEALGSDPTKCRNQHYQVLKSAVASAEIDTSCSTSLDCSSLLHLWGGSDSEECTGKPASAPPHAHTRQPQPPTPPPEDDDPDPYFLALVACCLIDTSAMQEGDGYSLQLGAAVRSLRQKGVQPDEVRAFGQWWRTEHMRNGSPPELCQVIPNWLRFTAWRKAHQPALRRDAMVVEVAALSEADREAVRERGKAELAGVKARMNGNGNGRHSNGRPPNPAAAARHGPGPGRARAPTPAGVARAAEAAEAGGGAGALPGGPGGGGPGARAAEGSTDSGLRPQWPVNPTQVASDQKPQAEPERVGFEGGSLATDHRPLTTVVMNHATAGSKR